MKLEEKVAKNNAIVMGKAKKKIGRKERLYVQLVL